MIKINEAGRLRGAHAGAGAKSSSRTIGTTLAKNPIRVAVLPGVDRERSVRAAHATSGPNRAQAAAITVTNIPKGISLPSPEDKATGEEKYKDFVAGKIGRFIDKEQEFASKPRVAKEPGLTKKDAAALGIKTIAAVGAKHRAAGAEAEKHPGAPPFHAGNLGSTRPDVPELTGSPLTPDQAAGKRPLRHGGGGTAARTSYDVTPQNVEFSGEVADSGLLGHKPLSAITAKSVTLPSRPHFPGDAKINAILHALKLPTKSSEKQVTVISPRGTVRKGSEAEYLKRKGVNVTDAPKRPLKDSVMSFSNLLEYILKWTGEWKPRKVAGEERPTPAGPASTAKRPVAGFPKGPRRHYTQSGGEITPPKAIERAKAEFDALFKQEENMNPDKIANEIIREAFTSSDRRNTTPNTNGMADKGGTARLMLSGEWFGSTAWPFDQSSSSDFEKSAELQASQAKAGQGEGTSSAPSMVDSVSARDIVDNLLEDSPASIFDDPESVGYMLRVLGEAGYTEFAQRCSEICENATEESVVEVSKMIEKLEADKADPYLVEGLQDFAALIISENEEEMDPSTEAKDAKTPDESAPETSGE